MAWGDVTWKVWNGEQIISRVDKASKDALQETIEEAVFIAKPLTKIKTGRARGSIAAKGVVVIGTKAVGEWGSYGVPYFVYLNNGTVRIPAGRMLEQASAIAYPRLAGRIKARI